MSSKPIPPTPPVFKTENQSIPRVMEEAEAVGWIRIDEDISFKASSLIVQPETCCSNSHRSETRLVPTKDDDSDHAHIKSYQRDLGESTKHNELSRDPVSLEQSNTERELGLASPEWLLVDDEISLHCKTKVPNSLKPKLVTNENLHDGTTPRRGAHDLLHPLHQRDKASSFSSNSSHLVDRAAPMPFISESEPQNLSSLFCKPVRYFTGPVSDVQKAVSFSADSCLESSGKSNAPLTERANAYNCNGTFDNGNSHFVASSFEGDGVFPHCGNNIIASTNNNCLSNDQNFSCNDALDEQTTFHNGFESANSYNSESDDCMIIEKEPSVIVIESEEDSFTEEMNALMIKCNASENNDFDENTEFEINPGRCDLNTKKDQNLLQTTCSKLIMERLDKCKDVSVECNRIIKVEPSESTPENLAAASPQTSKELETEIMCSSCEPENECPLVAHLPMYIKAELMKDTNISTGHSEVPVCENSFLGVVDDHNKGVETPRLTSLKNQEKMDTHETVNCYKTSLASQHPENQEHSQQIFNFQNSFAYSHNPCSDDQAGGYEVRAPILNLSGEGKSHEHEKKCKKEKASGFQQMLGNVKGVPHIGSVNVSEELANYDEHEILKDCEAPLKGKNSDHFDFMMNRSPVNFCVEVQDHDHIMQQQKNKTSGGSQGEGQRRGQGHKQPSSGKKQSQGQKTQIYEPYMSRQQINDGIKRGHLIVSPENLAGFPCTAAKSITRLLASGLPSKKRKGCVFEVFFTGNETPVCKLEDKYFRNALKFLTVKLAQQTDTDNTAIYHLQGPIRINPKNYEDAYVPMPDGRADIYIQGMADRNRAFNTDNVVVLLHDSSKWRVFVEDFENFERSQSFSTNGEPDVDNDEVDEDSEPDVIFENDNEGEEEKHNPESETANQDDDDGGVTTAVTDTATGIESLVSGLKGLSVEGAGPDIPSTVPTQAGNKAGKSRAMKKVESASGKLSTKSGSPFSKKFSSVSDMAKYGSRLAKNLFGSVSSSSIKEGEAGRFLQRTGKVVYIYEKKHSRAASGHIKLMPDKNKNFALFSPMDSRIPRIVVPMAECPKDFMERADDYARTLFIARIQEWNETSKMPKGTLCRSLGEAGQIEPETEAMLIEMDVDDSPFSSEVEKCLPQDLPWTIPKEELSSRRDLRRMCIFTIDPATARDLDDAVSIEEMENGLFSVGVHIADVSYFVQENTELDTVASKRATSVYLIQKVIPMLPRLLCEELCSLNPDTDRLTFSVMWTINDQGEIFDEWYGRTVIRSCAKLSYDHAQGFIEEPTKKWTQDELPPISNSFGVEDVMKRVLQLNKLAVALRKQRFDNGALRLDQVKLQYSLNSETGMPNGYYVYQQRDSNRLIEEFMLLANMAVAHKIKHAFPELAILRRHPAPQVKPLEAVEEMCESLGMKINTGTAGSLQESLRKYYKDDEFSAARLQVLIVLLSKPMQNARYFCTGSFPDEALYHHYALNVPLYTHFTSPIRRYPDIMVHRLLAASLGYCEPTKKATGHLQKEAEFCNDKKNNAKMASDRSSDMFFALFVKEAGPLEEMGMVMAVLDKAFDVLILKLGVTKRVYLDKLPLLSSKFRKNHKTPELAIVWAADEACSHRTQHLITLFTKVQCYVYADKEPLRWSCVIKRPSEELKPLSAEESLS